MGNTHVQPQTRNRNKKQVHWKAADRPSPPGKPQLSNEIETTPDVITIRWSRPLNDGGSPITGYLVEHRRTGSPHWVRATPLLVPFPELTLSGLEPGWRYQFRASAENAVGLSNPSDISEPITVTLQRSAITAPRFIQELTDTVALENEKCEFVAQFLGQPAPKVCWFKDGFEIFSSRRIRIITDNEKSVLTIHQCSLSDEGEIKCTATNRAGHVSTKAKLNIEAPPSIRLPRQYEDGLLFELGEVIRLKVSIAGRPNPLVFWSHDGETIQNNDRYEIERKDKSFVLKIDEARRSDRGEYQIKAVNKLGEDVASFLVTVTDKPSPPGRARVVMTLGRSVTLSWSIPGDDGGCKIGNYIVEYYRLGWNVWLKAATSRQLTTILGDLIEGSEYKFRVKAESPYGISEPGEESEVVFIPDPRRGIVQPPSRSKSQPRDFLEDVSKPVAAKRKKTRSQSSSRVEATTEVPVRPERTKIKTPQKTPEGSPMIQRRDIDLNFNKHLLDRGQSIARDLSYGTPEIKEKKSPPEPTQRKLSIPDRTTASSMRNHPNNISGSSEFMLVLYPDENTNGTRDNQIQTPVNISFSSPDRSSELFDFENAIPPPLSLSAPELCAEPPQFDCLRRAASSTELLYERAMMRINETVAAEEAELERRRKSIPKIQINSKDDEDIVGLETKHSLRRRLSSSGVPQQHAAWAQKRHSLKTPNELINELTQNKLQRTLQTQASFEKKKISIIEEKQWMEEYEESLSESETDTEDEDENETYRPPFGTVKDEPFEILTKPKLPPDPSFVPKPILKKTDPENNSSIGVTTKRERYESYPPILQTPPRSSSPRPGFLPRDRSKSLAVSSSVHPMPRIPSNDEIFEEKPPTTRPRSHSLLPHNELQQIKAPKLEKLKPVSKFNSITAVAELSAITAASIVIPKRLIEKKTDAEEQKVVADHYGDIVKNYGQKRRRSSTGMFLDKDEINTKKSQEVLTDNPFASHYIAKTTTKTPSPIPKRKEIVTSPKRRGSTSSGRTPVVSPSRPENWSKLRTSDMEKPKRKSSASPMSVRRKSKSPSPLPLAKKKPMLREISIQTSVDCGKSIPMEKQRHEELLVNAERKVRGAVDYVTDIAMFVVACWLYLFNNELLAIPVLLVMVYRQLWDEIYRRMPKWLVRRLTRKRTIRR